MPLNDITDRLVSTFQQNLPNLLVALAVLVVGWVVALVAAAIVRGFLQRTRLDDRLAQLIAPEAEEAAVVRIESWLSRGVFYLILLFAFVEFLRRLRLEAVTEPTQVLLTTVLDYLPRLVAAGLILLVAWIIALIVRFVVERAGHIANLDQRLAQQAGLEEQPVSVARSLATAAYWLTFLFFLPGVFEALQIKGLGDAVQGMLTRVLTVVPDIVASGIILVAGWFVARILRQIVTNLLVAAGADQLGERAGLGPAAERSLSWAVGTIVYAIVLISVIIAALQALRIRAISDPATAMLEIILAAIPDLIAAALLLAVAYLIGRLVASLTTTVLTGIGFNELPTKLGFRQVPAEGERMPAEYAGYLTLVAIMLFASMEAADLLGFRNLAELLENFIAFGADVFLALVIFGIGLYLANVAHGAVLSAAGAQASLWATLTRAAIIVFVAAMALQQMGIGQNIVSLAFGLVVGTVAVAIGLGAALAIGLGSRDIAGREVERLLETLRGQRSPRA